MKKYSLITLSILGCIGSLTFSGKASLIEENLVETGQVYNLKNLSNEDKFISNNNKISESQPFNKTDYDKALAQHLNRLRRYSTLSQEERQATRFKIGEIYYDYAEHTQKLRDKAALLEQAKIHFKASQFSEAKDYLDKIKIFDDEYED